MVKTPIMNEVWDNAKDDIFRLESIPEYKVPSDLLLFEKWKKRELIFDENDDWFKRLKETKSKDISMKRVRIVPLPISDYIKYEIDFWKISTKYGEQILFLSLKDYEKMKSSLDFFPEDFWMFDNNKLIIFHYEEGDLKKEILIEDKELIQKYLSFKKELIKASIPMKRFLEIHSTADRN
jgi:hypothetical protein